MTKGARDDRFEIEHMRTARCSPDAIMSRILEPSSWPEWQSEIVTTGPPGTLKPGDAVEGRARLLGFEVDGRSSAIVVAQGVFEEDVIVGVRMRVRYEVEEAPEGARVTRRLTAVLPRGVNGRLLSFFLKRRLRKMQTGVLDRLVTQAESG
ncbi:MAG: SRPBCC family protein [Actinomycetota bacterium]|nr:SRPBCC family protein [Actinomycetota bacterium]